LCFAASLRLERAQSWEVECRSIRRDTEQIRQLLLIDFRTILDPAGFREQLDRSEIWRQWQLAQYPLHIVIDSVDEGVFKLGDFLSQLTQICKNSSTPADRKTPSLKAGLPNS